MFLHENIQYVTVLIDGSPEIMALTTDRHKQLIKKLGIAGKSLSMPNLIRKRLIELAAPLPYGLIGQNNASSGE